MSTYYLDEQNVHAPFNPDYGLCDLKDKSKVRGDF